MKMFLRKCMAAAIFSSAAATAVAMTISPQQIRQTRLYNMNTILHCSPHNDHDDNNDIDIKRYNTGKRKTRQKIKSNQENKSTKTTSRRSFLHSTSTTAAAAATSTTIITGGNNINTPPPPANAATELTTTRITSTTSSSISQQKVLLPLAPFSTRRKYKSITLSSGLSILLVSDTGFTRCNAALSIGGAGQFADPLDLPGCAHLMEHMTLSGRSGNDSGDYYSAAGGGKTKSLERWLENNFGWNTNDKKDRENKEEEDDEVIVDFEEWIGDKDGASNAFTSPNFVCFHFTCPPTVLQESLSRFAQLFIPSTIRSVCNKSSTLKREIQRVNEELEYGSDAARSFYLLKRRASVQHPFSRFGAGSLDTLERKPKLNGVNVSERLVAFFEERYRADRAVLVVVSPNDIRTMERWVVPAFGGVLSKGSISSPSLLAANGEIDEEKKEDKTKLAMGEGRLSPGNTFGPPYPDPYPVSPAFPDKFTQTILLKSREDPLFNENIETLTLEWPLDLEYDGLNNIQPKNSSNDSAENYGGYQATASAVGFIISQILGRRGPGGLYSFLLRRGWVPSGTKGVPRLSFPVDVSGFQILKMEIGLTPEGFANRGAVIAAVYKSINAVSRIATPGKSGTGGGPSFLLPREILLQYVTIATIHGYALTPRPPDAVELAVDAQIYGIGSPSGVGVTGQWNLMPSTEDAQGIELLRYAVDYALSVMADPLRTMVTIAASAKVLSLRKSGIVNAPVPWPPSEPLWTVEPVTGAAYHVENGINLPGLVDPLVFFEEVLGVEGDALGPPVINPLVPARLREARPVLERISPATYGGPRYFYLSVEKDKTFWRPFFTPTPLISTMDSEWQNMDKAASSSSSWEERALAARIGEDWKLWQTASTTSTSSVLRLQLPMAPPEPTCRCAFVFQLISNKPLEATPIQAAHAELWRMSFDDAIIDLAELGAPAGLAYDMTFNAHGLRICFRGISQTLPSYARRFCRRLIEHSMKLNDGNSILSTTTVNMAIDQATRRGGPLAGNPFRRTQIVSELRRATARDAAEEGMAFLDSCDLGGVALAQGDLLPQEALQLLTDLRTIFQNARTVRSDSETDKIPQTFDLQEILYPPFWKPRSSSPCLIAGVPLVSDACGRVKR